MINKLIGQIEDAARNVEKFGPDLDALRAKFLAIQQLSPDDYEFISQDKMIAGVDINVLVRVTNELKRII